MVEMRWTNRNGGKNTPTNHLGGNQPPTRDWYKIVHSGKAFWADMPISRRLHCSGHIDRHKLRLVQASGSLYGAMHLFCIQSLPGVETAYYNTYIWASTTALIGSRRHDPSFVPNDPWRAILEPLLWLVPPNISPTTTYSHMRGNVWRNPRFHLPFRWEPSRSGEWTGRWTRC